MAVTTNEAFCEEREQFPETQSWQQFVYKKTLFTFLKLERKKGLWFHRSLIGSLYIALSQPRYCAGMETDA